MNLSKKLKTDCILRQWAKLKEIIRSESYNGIKFFITFVAIEQKPLFGVYFVTLRPVETN
jgi:hypothetical protein